MIPKYGNTDTYKGEPKTAATAVIQIGTIKCFTPREKAVVVPALAAWRLLVLRLLLDSFILVDSCLVKNDKLLSAEQGGCSGVVFAANLLFFRRLVFHVDKDQSKYKLLVTVSGS